MYFKGYENVKNRFWFLTILRNYLFIISNLEYVELFVQEYVNLLIIYYQLLPVIHYIKNKLIIL